MGKITTSELEKQVADNELMSKEVLQMSNKNQQYSRKFNIKILRRKVKINRFICEGYRKGQIICNS